jgi:nicotinamidase-related amidase
MLRDFALTVANSVLLVIDMQERFQSAIPAMTQDQPCGRNCRILLAGAQLLGVATLISEQYPKGLGETVSWLQAAHPGATRMAKMHFSCIDDPAMRAHLDALKRPHVVLCGIEAHVCVLTTAADLLAQGVGVVVAGDALASRDTTHLPMACAALRDLGALVVPSESILMRWQRIAGSGNFKAISALIR